MTDNRKNRKLKPTLAPNAAAHQLGDIFAVSAEIGITDSEAALRLAAGHVNVSKRKRKSTVGILLGNIFTFFNLVYFVISTAFIIYAQYKQLVFLGVVAANTFIAIFQEFRSRRALDRLSVVTAPEATVVRSGKVIKIPADAVVLGDVIIFTAGNQIFTDCRVLEGRLEVNESILTGESDTLHKKVGETIFAGSFATGGTCRAVVSAVGADNYISTLENRARVYKKPKSQLNRTFRVILIVVCSLIVPLGVAMWHVNSLASNDFVTVLQKTSGPLLAIIPAGPFLLTSVALAVSVMRLAKNKTVVQELYCIEMLARADTLCLDKTGTITDGTMEVIKCVDLRQSPLPDSPAQAARASDFSGIIAAIGNALPSKNQTSVALENFFGTAADPRLVADAVIPFNSKNKFSAVSFIGVGTYFLGAPEFIVKNVTTRLADEVDAYASMGFRVLLLAHSAGQIYTPASGALPASGDTENTANSDVTAAANSVKSEPVICAADEAAVKLPPVRRPLALIVIEDHIRTNAQETLEWFGKNSVDIKVISGDNPATVSAIALRAGITGADSAISLEGMTDEQVAESALNHVIFGRVSPEQKCVLVKALQTAGRTVAMTGDGVNDILALREADCSIAFAAGADAARNVSHLVLTDNDFACLPKVVAEGRRVVNNIQKSSSLFFMKSIFTVMLMFFIIIADTIFGMAYTYPFSPTQIMLLETVVVGLPTVLLALQKNTEIIRGSFAKNVFKYSLNAAIVFFAATLSLYITNIAADLPHSAETLQTCAALTYTICGIYALYYASMPLNLPKLGMLVGVTAIVFIFSIAQRDFFDYVRLATDEKLLLSTVVLAAAPAFHLLRKIFNRERFI